MKYYQKCSNKGTIRCNESTIAKSIEEEMRIVTENKEPIKASVNLIYQERKEGVQPEYDIRTDRFDIALEAMDKVSKSIQAKREKKLAEETKQEVEPNKQD